MQHNYDTARSFYVSVPDPKKVGKARKVLDQRFADLSDDEEEKDEDAIAINSTGIPTTEMWMFPWSMIGVSFNSVNKSKIFLNKILNHVKLKA